MTSFDKKIFEYKNYLENSLPSFLPPTKSPQKDVVEAMSYSLLGGGKRVRGILTIAFYELFACCDVVHALPFAVAVEMIHAYSLIHDDLPCMDDDDVRRGQPANHIKYGEATALLAGDGLLTLAFQTISNPDNVKNIPPELVVKVVYTLSNLAGTDGMIGGQVLDLLNEQKNASYDEIVTAELLKTSALIKASALIGSIIGGAEEKDLETIALYGDNLGLAFQIIDDILDTTSTIEVLGKPINSDEENNKSTFTSVLGVEKSKKVALKCTQNAILSLQSLGKNTKFLEEFTHNLLERLN